MGKDGLLTCLAFGAKIPAKYAREDGTVFGGVKVEEWDGFHDYVRRALLKLLLVNGADNRTAVWSRRF